jgi:hypothetical protein
MLNKHKARLCVHGGQQTWGQGYWDTYAPVVTWASVRLLLIVAKIYGLKLKSIDFVLAFLQADWMYRFTWSFLQELIQLMSLMGTGTDTFSNLTRAFMVSSKLVTTGLRSSVKGLSLVTLSKVKLINVSSFGRTASFSHMLMIVLSLEKTWQSLMRLFLH